MIAYILLGYVTAGVLFFTLGLAWALATEDERIVVPAKKCPAFMFAAAMLIAFICFVAAWPLCLSMKRPE
jgi:hypothetical protein